MQFPRRPIRDSDLAVIFGARHDAYVFNLLEYSFMVDTIKLCTLYFEPPPAHPLVLPGVSDYFLSTTSVRLGNNARVTLRPDAIAMEPDEVLQLILTPTEATAVTLMRDTNAFLSDTLNVTIIDPNSKLNSQLNHNFIGTIKKCVNYIPRPNNSWANNFIWNSPYLD